MRRHQVILSLGGLVFAAALALPLALQAEEEPEMASEEIVKARSSEGDSSSVSEVSEDEIQPPTAVHTVPARYPKAEREAGVSGRVLLSMVIDVEGRPTSIEIVEGVEGHPAFAESAVEALAQWLFEPARKEGDPTEMKIAVPFAFQLK